MFEIKNGVCMFNSRVYRYTIFHYHADSTKMFVSFIDILDQSKEKPIVPILEFLTQDYILLS